MQIAGQKVRTDYNTRRSAPPPPADDRYNGDRYDDRSRYDDRPPRYDPPPSRYDDRDRDYYDRGPPPPRYGMLRARGAQRACASHDLFRGRKGGWAAHAIVYTARHSHRHAYGF